ncbi:serine/threonine-protein kinase [Streptomyces sp.]|uniref:serine/threonine-protein kinase n=1 Tax=Streptomyces sp. TaxID=1931 RepID=UPI002F4008FC
MGEVFAGRYELVDPIGRGGVGAVWRSWDHRRRRYVAAKVLQQSDAHALLRFVREQALRIDHPHVLAPASWAADDDKVLFTMDLVRGGSLSHLIGDYGPLPPPYVCVLLDQLLAGLTAVHAEGVVHRDIKPANILLEATGTGTPHVRLSDFGIAMRKGDARLTETDYVVGTPGYFAPEQMLGAEPDFPADLYAVGLVALFLLSGRKPDAEAIRERFVAMGMPSAPTGVPEPLWQVVGALLQPDPHARFRTATGARKALAAAIELIPEGGPGEEPVEVFDQIGPLPEGFGPDGPLVRAAARQAPPSADLTRGFPLAAPLAGPQAEPEAAAPGVPRAAPRSVPQAAPESLPRSAAQATPPPVPRSAPPRPAGRHAAPLPASGPITHTRTRAEFPPPAAPAAAPAQPLPQPEPPPHPQSQPQPQPAGAYPVQTADTASARLPARRPKPGPPAKVVIPVLVLAVICFTIGFVALAVS